MRGGFLDEFLNKEEFLMLKSICTAVMPLQLFTRVPNIYWTKNCCTVHVMPFARCFNLLKTSFQLTSPVRLDTVFFPLSSDVIAPGVKTKMLERLYIQYYGTTARYFVNFVLLSNDRNGLHSIGEIQNYLKQALLWL